MIEGTPTEQNFAALGLDLVKLPFVNPAILRSSERGEISWGGVVSGDNNGIAVGHKRFVEVGFTLEFLVVWSHKAELWT